MVGVVGGYGMLLCACWCVSVGEEYGMLSPVHRMSDYTLIYPDGRRVIGFFKIAIYQRRAPGRDGAGRFPFRHTEFNRELYHTRVAQFSSRRHEDPLHSIPLIDGGGSEEPLEQPLEPHRVTSEDHVFGECRPSQMADEMTKSVETPMGPERREEPPVLVASMVGGIEMERSQVSTQTGDRARDRAGHCVISERYLLGTAENVHRLERTGASAGV